MAEAIGPHIDIVLQRVRASGGVLHTREVVREMFTHAQRIINGALSLVVDSATLTTNPYQIFYDAQGEFSNSIRIVAVQEGGRDLKQEKNWKMFPFHNRSFFRETNSYFRNWCEIGRTLLLLYPAKDAASSVTVFYATLTSAFDNESVETEIPDEYLQLLDDLTAILLLARARDFKDLQELTQSIVRQTQEAAAHD